MDMDKHALLLILALLPTLQPTGAQQTLIPKSPKVTKLHFYLQDFIGGDKPTVWEVAHCNLTDILPSLFGKVVLMDDLVTSGPDVDSPQIGRLQGSVGLSDLREEALVILLNLVFTGGEYDGSTLSIIGRNPLGSEVREVSIVAGTGAFRMATGYIITSTYFTDPARVRNVYEYSAVVFHMDTDLLLSS